MTERAGDRWSTAWTFTLAALLVGFAIQLNLGRLDPGALLLLTLALPLAIIGLVRPRWPLIAERNVRFAIGVSLVVEFGLLFVWPPTPAPLLQHDAALLPFRVALVAALPLALLEVADRPALRRARMPILFGLWGVAAAWAIALSPVTSNDVWWFQQIGSRALLDGVNPYGIEMPNVFGPGSPYYAPETMQGDHLTFGLPYPPLSLLLTLPGFVLFGDVRYALLAAVLLAAALIAMTQPGPVARGAALLFLFTPRSFFVVAQAWTEPLVIALLALVVFMAVRRLNLVPVALGLLVAVKQHLVLALPVALLLAPPPQLSWRSGRAALVTLGVAAFLSIPFALWDPGGFWRSVVALQFQQPFRADALSFPAWLGLDHRTLAALIGFAAIVPVAALAAWRAARTPSGFAATVAVMYLCFFAFNKQAFANYYYFVIGALCCAVAAIRVPDQAAHEPG